MVGGVPDQGRIVLMIPGWLLSEPQTAFGSSLSGCPRFGLPMREQPVNIRMQQVDERVSERHVDPAHGDKTMHRVMHVFAVDATSSVVGCVYYGIVDGCSRR